MNHSRMLRSAILATAIVVAHTATAGSLSVVSAINNVKAGAHKPSGRLTTSGNGVSQRPAATSPVIVRPNGTVVSSAGLTKTGMGGVTLTAAGATIVYSAGNATRFAGGTMAMNTSAGAALAAMNFLTTANLVLSSGTVINNGGSSSSGSSSSSTGGTTTTISTGTIDLSTAATGTGASSGVIINTGNAGVVLNLNTAGNAGLTKAGAGTLILNNTTVVPGDLIINAGTIILANSLKVNSVKFGSSAAIEFSNAASTAEPLEVAGGVSVSDPGSAFTSGNVADIVTPAGAVFPDGTDIHVINATATGAVLTITNHSGAALVIKASTTVPNGITISRP